MLVTDGIHLIDGLKGANAYLLTGSENFLVDTGLPGQEKLIANYIDYVNNQSGHLQNLHGIILTHYDVDHVGNAVALQKIFQCPIYAHEIEIPYILQQIPRPGIKQYLPFLVRPLFGKLQIPDKILPLKAGDFLGEWEVIYTPGHTPGHIALYRNGVAIVGDLFQGGKIRSAPRLFTWNPSSLRRSMYDMGLRPLRWILPGHGPATAASKGWLNACIKQ